MRLILVIALGGLMHAARSFSPGLGYGTEAGQVTMTLGFLLLSAWLTGSLFASLGLPRLTGYLAAGMLAGPHALGLVSETTLVDLRIFNGMAVALIALSAGSELHLPSLRPLLRTIAWITWIAVLGTALLIALVAFLSDAQLPFLASLAPPQRIAVALVLGVTLVAQSPAVVMALRDEMRADGPVTRTVLGVVVLADLVVILLFAATSSFAKAMLGGETDAFQVAGELAWELLGSILAGLMLGVLVAMYLQKVERGGALFILTVCFLLAEVGQRVHLDPLLTALSMGMLIRNATGVSRRLHREVDASALPVYVTFFAVAGAGIHLHLLAELWIPAALLVAVRAGGLYGGARYAARQAGAPLVVQRFVGLGLLPQAGLALALALLFARTFPEFGREASALAFSVVALNELLAPIFYRLGLLRCGEAGALEPAPAEPETPAPTAPLQFPTGSANSHSTHRGARGGCVASPARPPRPARRNGPRAGDPRRSRRRRRTARRRSRRSPRGWRAAGCGSRGRPPAGCARGASCRPPGPCAGSGPRWASRRARRRPPGAACRWAARTRRRSGAHADGRP